MIVRDQKNELAPTFEIKAPALDGVYTLDDMIALRKLIDEVFLFEPGMQVPQASVLISNTQARTIKNDGEIPRLLEKSFKHSDPI